DCPPAPTEAAASTAACEASGWKVTGTFDQKPPTRAVAARASILGGEGPGVGFALGGQLSLVDHDRGDALLARVVCLAKHMAKAVIEQVHACAIAVRGEGAKALNPVVDAHDDRAVIRALNRG